MKIHELTKIASKSSLIVESKSGKITHLVHLEDLMLDLGMSGLETAITILDNVRDIMYENNSHNSVTITTKFDGSPAIVAGIDPADGKFFVGTKSVFAASPKIIKSTKDLSIYSDKPGLQKKLAVALQFLPELGITGVMQGDMMFTSDDLQKHEINGKNYVTFRPNTLTYAVEVNTPDAREIMSSKIGIVFHTMYEGTTLESMRAVHNADISNMIKSSENVWAIGASIEEGQLTDAFNTAFQEKLTKLRDFISNIDESAVNRIVLHDTFKKLIKPYINSRIRNKTPMIGNITQFAKGLVNFYQQRVNNEIQKLKSGPDSEVARTKIKRTIEFKKFLTDNSSTLNKMFMAYKVLISLKLSLIKKLPNTHGINTFLRTESGYKDTAPEGFVVSDKNGNIVKMNDRLTFNHANFVMTNAWKDTGV